METIIIILLLVLLAEATYLVTRASRPQFTKRPGRQMFVDTSVLIDGRILAIARSGFVADTLLIPRSVIGELQFLADNADSDKRTRARHGLDVVTELQALDGVTVEIFPDGSRAEEGVDERLLKLAKQHDAVLCTIDYNLNKVAQVEGIPVANVNDLAMTLRMAHLPGEKLSLALTTKGNDGHQAVGHLEDGTMVVVEQAKARIGQVVEVEIIRSLQTAAGRMMFARLTDKKQRPADTGSVEQPAKEKVASKTPSQRGRRSIATPKGVAKSQEIEKEATRATQSTPRNPRGRGGRSSSRKTNEDRLIELLNGQDQE